MAAPVQFGDDAFPIGWTAEAVALAWVASRRGHPYSAMVASGLYVLAGAYLVQSFGLSGLNGTESPMIELAAHWPSSSPGPASACGSCATGASGSRLPPTRSSSRSSVPHCGSTVSLSWSC